MTPAQLKQIRRAMSDVIEKDCDMQIISDIERFALDSKSTIQQILSMRYTSDEVDAVNSLIQVVLDIAAEHLDEDYYE